MKRLVLFDIDETMISSDGAGRRAIGKALAKRFGGDIDTIKVSMSGKTDPQILTEILRTCNIDDAEIESSIDEILEIYLTLLQAEIDRSSAYIIHNGIPELLDLLHAEEAFCLGLLTGNIEKVKALKIAVLGTDSAVGKRTTAWIIVHALRRAGYKAEMIGTGQTAWMQGAKYSIVLDSLINDFVAGELENATYQAWVEKQPDVIVLEGQGSLMNPAYPGGHEILAACRPDIVVLQHAPKRLEYDGFPGYLIQPLPIQVEAVELLSGKPVVAITINHENMAPEEVGEAALQIKQESGLPAFDVLLNGADGLIEVLTTHLKKKAETIQQK